MKFFEAVPSELFSPLASPNRMLYADALDVLYSAYRENLKIREDVLYSMLRSRLEQQLADATFEGEDIDEEEFRDISGRARFLIRKLCSKGWFEKERGDDFEEYITVPSYSSRLLELFHQLREDSPVRGYSYVRHICRAIPPPRPCALRNVFVCAEDGFGKRKICAVQKRHREDTGIWRDH